MSDDAGADEPVPKLPRGRGLKFSGPELFRILMTLVSLIGVLVLAKPCANSVSTFVTGYQQGSGSNTTVKPGTVEPPPPPANLDQYEQLRPGMSDQEIKAAIERSKAKAAAAKGAPTTNAATPTGDSASLRRGEVNTGSAAAPAATKPTTTATTKNIALPPSDTGAPAPSGSATPR